MEMLLCLSSSVLLRKANTALINTLSLANLILVKMLPQNYGKPTPFLFASALLRSINIYICVCVCICVYLYMCVFVYVCVYFVYPLLQLFQCHAHVGLSVLHRESVSHSLLESGWQYNLKYQHNILRRPLTGLAL